jgi:putative oxidoreductase
MNTAVNANISSAAGIAADKPVRGFGIALWIAQILLALVFGFAGSMKLLTPIAELAKNAEWIKNSELLIRFIGLSEVAGALGLLLPALTRIKPKLTSLAAVGIFVIMVLATGFHLMRGEAKFTPMTIGLGALALFVAWGRFRKVPIAPRNQVDRR